MDKLKEFLKKYPKEGKGLDDNIIKEIQNKFQIKFPSKYYEFLKLSGAFFDPLNMDYWFDYIEEGNVKAKQNIQRYGVDLGRNIWVVAELDASMIISFFYLDEGDNPPMYRLDLHHFVNIELHHEEMKTYGRLVEADPIDESYEYLLKMSETFSDYINKKIDRYNPEYD